MGIGPILLVILIVNFVIRIVIHIVFIVPSVLSVLKVLDYVFKILIAGIILSYFYFVFLGNWYCKKGNNAKAEKHFLKMKAFMKKAWGKEHPAYAIVLNNLGSLYSIMGDYTKAESYYLEAETIMKKWRGKKHLYYTLSLIDLGSLYWDMGYFAKAEKYCLEAETIMEKWRGKKHPYYYTLSLNNMGLLYIMKGDYAKAEKFCLEAEASEKKYLGKKYPYYALSLHGLGLLYYSIGDYAKAENYFLEAKAIKKKALGKEHLAYAASLDRLGTLYRDMGVRDMGNYAKAENIYLEVKAIYEKALSKEYPGFISLLNNFFILYLDMKEYKQALSIRKEAYQLNMNLINKVFSSFSKKERETYWNTHSSSFEESYSLSWFYPVPESHALNYDNALFTKSLLLRTANAIRDTIYSSGNEGLIKQYEDLLSLHQRIGALQQRGGVNERDFIYSSGDKGLIMQYVEFLILRRQTWGSQQKEGANEEYIQELERQADALDKSLTQTSTAYKDANKELKEYLAIGWENVRDSLQPGEAAIEFVSFNLFDKKWTGKIIYAALILRYGMETPVWVNLCEETDLAEFFKKLDGKDPTEQARILYEEDGLELYARVWQPLEKILEEAKTVYYSPSGLLHKISFNAIPAREGVLLSSVYDLNLVSSTREIARRKNKIPEKSGSAALYGGLEYDIDADKTKQESHPDKNQRTQIRSMPPEDVMRGGSWQNLPESSDECWFIQQQLEKNNIDVALYDYEKGNKKSFKNLNGKRTGIIHLATHGFFWDDIEKNYEERERLERLGVRKKALENPLLRSGLALSGANNGWGKKAVEGVENGILFAADIVNINLVGTDLVALSACETGLGVVNNKEGVFGLQRAFKLAGAETIVMSLWKVDDNATKEFMKQFYENWLSKGMSKQKAFKEAQRRLRETKEYSSPYYWAAFVMMD